MHSVDTKSEIVKILHFKQFYKHYVFVEDGEGGRKKVLKNYIDVNVCIDMVCGDTKNALESEDYYMMRWIIKIILFPISLVLSILTAFLTFLLGIGTALLYLLMMFCIFGAIASFMQKEVAIGIEALVLGFLLSPYGIPMVGAAVIAFLQEINEAIKSI